MSAHTDAGRADTPQYVFDAERLRAVAASGLLVGGPVPEPEFDRYSRLAAAITGAPIARLSIVDGRGQHFKSAVGPLPASGRDTPLTHAICKHVVGARAPLLIPDTHADARVCDNGAVTDDATGAYLGVPVRWPDGHVLGAFCIADREPRGWSAGDRAAVEDLAAAVDTELALRAALTAARGRAYRDALTGLPNRRQLSADLDDTLRGRDPARLVLLDFDGFNAYNDRFGHRPATTSSSPSRGACAKRPAAVAGAPIA